YRDEDFFLPEDDTVFETNDELVLLTDSKHLQKLRNRFIPKTAEKSEGEEDNEVGRNKQEGTGL
ncbi:MAG: hypothetical protein GWN14_27850, partial [candidate division Zixibacteria bacterium]|nr:hypothetical protein [candidate division Zixibacteria bacterium]